MHKGIIHLAEDCFRDARITDEICVGTEKKYISSIRKFLSVINVKKMEELSNDDFDNFILKMKDNGASNSRIRNVISAMVWIVNKLQNKGIIFNNFNMLTIKKPKVIKKEVNYLTEQEVAIFLNCVTKDIEKKPMAKNIRFMAFVMILFQTGARIGEVLSIDINDLDRQNKEVRIIGKGSKPRTLCLREEALHWIDKYLDIRKDSERALFATQDGTSRWKQTDVGRAFRKYKKTSGIKKDFVVHTIRHTFATQYLLRGVGLPVVQAALGHSDPMTTLKYYSGAVEKVKVKEMINDKHFDFIPKAILERINSS
ncbi:MAG: tyrosine-type recombinase/integrase [Candidatus Moraniibacteriota bacterium]